MEAQQLLVDSLANDIANINTHGYKKGKVKFSELLYQPVTEEGMPVDKPQQPEGVPGLGSGVRVETTTKDFSQGTLIKTSEPLNLVIEGNGFFGVYGPDNELYLTRDGNFHCDKDGNIVNSSGYRLDTTVFLPQGVQNISINTDGTVTGEIDGEVENLGQLNLYTVPNTKGLEAVGNNLYRETPASGMAEMRWPGEKGVGSLRSGYLEGSNVELASTMTKMIVAQRAYEVNARSIKIADEMWGIANNIRR